MDAALDLNHTQNIGRMIKQHFPQSQFIVVGEEGEGEEGEEGKAREAGEAGKAGKCCGGGACLAQQHVERAFLSHRECGMHRECVGDLLNTHVCMPAWECTHTRPHSPHCPLPKVSLKEGMFNNANVIFRTKFVDGVSAVTRTVPARDKGAENRAR